MRLPSDTQRRFFEQAATQYQADLAADTFAQAYLTGRGIGPEAARSHRLGVVRNPLKGHEQFTGRLVIPYVTPAGVVTFSFRCLQNHVCKDVNCPKYLPPEGMERTLYNVLDFRKDSTVVYVCEGEIDTLSLSLSGFPAIGVPGATHWKPHFTRCFMDYAQVFCVADGDEAGRKMGHLLASEVQARIIRPPRGADVNDLYTQGGAHAVQQWLAGATG